MRIFRVTASLESSVPLQSPSTRVVDSNILQASHDNDSKTKKYLKIGSKFGLSSFKYFIYTSTCFAALLMTTAGNIIINLGLNIFGVFPPKALKEDKAKKNHESIDNVNRFLKNFPGFDEIMAAVQKANIDLKTLNKNSKSQLNTRDDIEELIKLLKNVKDDPEVEDGIQLLENFVRINDLTWGPKLNNGDCVEWLTWLCEESSLDEQMKFVLKVKKGNVTEDDMDKLKDILRVKEYSIDKDTKGKTYIKSVTYEVAFPDYSAIKPIDIAFENLSSVKDKSEPLSVQIANKAFLKLVNEDLTKGGNNIPETPMSVSIRDYKNHLIINTMALTDSELEEILKQSDELIPVIKYSTANKITGAIRSLASLGKPSTIRDFSLCFVKNYDKEKGTTLIGAHGIKDEYENLEEFRSRVPFIIARKEDIPLINLKSLFLLAGGVLVLYGTHKGTKKINVMLNPSYESLQEKAKEKTGQPQNESSKIT